MAMFLGNADQTTAASGVRFWSPDVQNAVMSLLAQKQLESFDARFAKGVVATGVPNISAASDWVRARVAEGKIVLVGLLARSAGQGDTWIGLPFLALDASSPKDRSDLEKMMMSSQQELEATNDDALWITGDGSAVLTGPPDVLAQLRGDALGADASPPSAGTDTTSPDADASQAAAPTRPVLWPWVVGGLAVIGGLAVWTRMSQTRHGPER